VLAWPYAALVAQLRWWEAARQVLGRLVFASPLTFLTADHKMLCSKSRFA
jgi:hypothetical protein